MYQICGPRPCWPGRLMRSRLRSAAQDDSVPNMGTTKPKLGSKPARRRSPKADRSKGLASQLFTRTQQQVLGLLFGQPARTFRLSELIALAGVGSGAVQREVARLVAGGLVSMLVRDGQKIYRANDRSPIFPELCSIVEKTSGIAERLRWALAPLAKEITLAILFGSVAKGTDTADSDIDLLIVSDTLQLEDIFRILGPVEEGLGRSVNPTLYTIAELEARRRTKNPFLTKVLSGKHQVLLGEMNGNQGTRESGDIT